MLNTGTVISVGLLATTVEDAGYIRTLHAWLAERYRYYEIIVMTNPSDHLMSEEDNLLSLPDIRLAVLNDNAPPKVLRKKIFELAIGDVVVILDPTESDCCVIERLVDVIIDGHDFAGNEYAEETMSCSWHLNSVFCSLLSKLSGCSVNGNLSYTGAYSRALVNSINASKAGQDDLRLLLATAGFISSTVKEAARAPRSGRAILRKLGGSLDIIGSVPHRLLLLTAWLSLAAFLINILYLLYVVCAWLFLPQIQPGWTSTGLTQSVQFAVLFFVLFVFSCIFSSQIGRNVQNRYIIARDVSRSECIISFNHLNVTARQ